ncbi:hypothetical protein THAOC_29511 [Thalassiosira oceanica]|uniref:Uncharacterized protein n=1 Tax=Thalassiosira oceanica TaxID=159749 RepID=K0RDP1_THAOC|nr:hypothetical protein THAOC_29511 [Thalassiosira oceanica]|eukprot:EJK51325.1 hypothetical protein THAOC_29511 [Thalassiosira oceanica]
MAVEFTMIDALARRVLPELNIEGRTGWPKWNGSVSTKLAEDVHVRRAMLREKNLPSIDHSLGSYNSEIEVVEIQSLREADDEQLTGRAGAAAGVGTLLNGQRQHREEGARAAAAAEKGLHFALFRLGT